MRQIHLVFAIVAIGGLLLSSSTSMAQDKEKKMNAPDQKIIKTVKEAWEGYDPRKEPLEIEVFKETSDQNGKYQEMYFTGETINGEKVRVYGIYGAPLNMTRVPAVLHIHGGGQTASMQWVQFWAARGYACMSIDYCGDWDGRKEFTKWGNFKMGNMKLCGAGRYFEPNVHASSWYHWAKAERRAISVLEKQKEVDPQKIGIYGISTGGTLTWMVAGSDDRVKAAVPIYGNGWDSYAGFGAPGDAPKGDPDANQKIWRTAMSSEAHAKYIKCPVLFLSSTNDHHGLMDRVYDTFAEMDKKVIRRQAFTLRYTHHIEPTEGADLPRWMDWCLRGTPEFPETPKAKITLGEDGVPMLTVEPDTSRDLKEVNLYYAVQNEFPITRFWRTAKAEQVPGKQIWTAKLPVLDVNQPLFAFANAGYKSKMMLSSNLVKVIPAELSTKKITAVATDKPSVLINDFSKGIEDWVFVPAYTDPCITDTYLKSGPGPDGRIGLTMNTAFCKGFMWVSTHKTGDPKWKGSEGAKLNFVLWGEAPNKLRIIATENQWRNTAKEFSTTVTLMGGAAWQEASFAPGDFKDKDGAALVNWDKVDRLEVKGENLTGKAPVIAEVKWVK